MIVTKKDAIEHWLTLQPDQNPLPHMDMIPYKADGSTFGACGIRIDGNPAFIDAVLSNLKPLLNGESNTTRLGLSRNPVKPTEIKGEVKEYKNKVEEAEVCYIRLHERGREAKRMNKLFNLHEQEDQVDNLSD